MKEGWQSKNEIECKERQLDSQCQGVFGVGGWLEGTVTVKNVKSVKKKSIETSTMQSCILIRNILQQFKPICLIACI